MKKKVKGYAVLATAMAISVLIGTTSFAAGWIQDDTGWWYGTNEDNSRWHSSGWQWLDGNGDGTAECYFFDQAGYMLENTTAPDGYQVNENGAWMENGIVQTRAAGMQEMVQNPEGTVQMRITVGDQVLTAMLEDNATTHAIADRLPMTLTMLDLYSREMCYRFEEALPANEAGVSGFEVGDIIYWPPRHSFVIMYHQDGEQFEMQKVGRINASAETIGNLFGNGNVSVTFELID